MAKQTVKRAAMKTSILVEKQVHALLTLSPAYQQLSSPKQKQAANSIVKIGTYLAAPEGIAANTLPGTVTVVPGSQSASDFAEEVNFPNFVANLIKGVFQSVVDSSIQQMNAYAELLNAAAKTVDQFTKDNVTDEDGRDWLAATYPEYFERDEKSGSIQFRPKFDRAKALERFRLLPLSCSLKKLAPTDVEKVLVPAARRRIAATRQQLLATMVLMGTNR